MKINISVLGSGSSGNSIYIDYCGKGILIDAGLSGKKTCDRLKKCGLEIDTLEAILLTHEHQDHIKGAGILSRKCNLPLYANEKTWEAACNKLGKVKEKNQHIIKDEFMIGDIGIKPFSISHDASDPVGYILQCADKKIAIATDMGYITPEIREQLKGMDFLIIEANHDLELLMRGSYPPSLKKRIRGKRGHLSNDDTADLLPKIINSNNPCILLAHLSKDNNIPDLAYITIKNSLEKNQIKIGQDLELGFTYREKPTKVYQV